MKNCICFFCLVLIIDFTKAQVPNYKQGDVLHYKVTIIENGDSATAKKIPDFQIKIDSLIHYECGSTLILFSQYFDRALTSNVNNNAIYLYYGRKLFIFYVKSPKEFINEYSHNFAFWNSQLKDSINLRNIFLKYKNIYSISPFINFEKSISCEIADSVFESSHNPVLSFCCVSDSTFLDFQNASEKVTIYSIHEERDTEDYYYSKRNGVMLLNAENKIEGKYLNYSFLLYKIN